MVGGMGVGIGLSGPPFRKAKWVNHRGPCSYILWGVLVSSGGTNYLLDGMLRGLIDLLHLWE